MAGIRFLWTATRAWVAMRLIVRTGLWIGGVGGWPTSMALGRMSQRVLPDETLRRCRLVLLVMETCRECDMRTVEARLV